MAWFVLCSSDDAEEVVLNGHGLSSTRVARHQTLLLASNETLATSRPNIPATGGTNHDKTGHQVPHFGVPCPTQ